MYLLNAKLRCTEQQLVSPNSCSVCGFTGGRSWECEGRKLLLLNRAVTCIATNGRSEFSRNLKQQEIQHYRDLSFFSDTKLQVSKVFAIKDSKLGTRRNRLAHDNAITYSRININAMRILFNTLC